MATGRQPFPGDTPGTVHDAILNRAPVPAGRVNPELPLPIEGVINKALEKERGLRYQHAADLRAELQRLKRDTDFARAAAAGGVVARGRARPGWGVKTGAAAGALALGALLALGTWSAIFRAEGEAIDSIAVLPFANATNDPNAEYLSDGITETLINSLTQLPRLRVTARSTVFRYKGKDADSQKVGNDLRVRAVLSGRLLQQGDTLIVRTELMDVSNGSQLWGGQYSRKASDVFALQEDLSREISEKLRLRLTPEERQRLTKRHTENANAYQLYLKGKYHWNKRSPEGIQRAVEYFQQAVDTDPAYALAYAGLADSYNIMSFFNMVPPRSAMPKAKASAMKALEIDSGLAEPHISLGYASFTFDWDWPAARTHIDQALALNASAVLNHTAYPFYLTVSGRPEEAVSVAQQALDRDPVSASFSHNLAVQFHLAGQFDKAIEEGRRTIELDSDIAIAHDVLAMSFAAKGMYREALLEMERAIALSPASAVSLGNLGYVRARLGQRSEAQHIVEQLDAASRERYTPALAFAAVYSGLDEKDQAFTWLDKAYEERCNRLAYLKNESTWTGLRGDPRFDDLLRRIGLPASR